MTELFDYQLLLEERGDGGVARISGDGFNCRIHFKGVLMLQIALSKKELGKRSLPTYLSKFNQSTKIKLLSEPCNRLESPPEEESFDSGGICKSD